MNLAGDFLTTGRNFNRQLIMKTFRKGNYFKHLAKINKNK